jgi:hypothetical protein
MWEPRCLTTLLTSTACYRDSFTFYLLRRVGEAKRSQATRFVCPSARTPAAVTLAYSPVILVIHRRLYNYTVCNCSSLPPVTLEIHAWFCLSTLLDVYKPLYSPDTLNKYTRLWMAKARCIEASLFSCNTGHTCVSGPAYRTTLIYASLYACISDRAQLSLLPYNTNLLTSLQFPVILAKPLLLYNTGKTQTSLPLYHIQCIDFSLSAILSIHTHPCLLTKFLHWRQSTCL